MIDMFELLGFSAADDEWDEPADPVGHAAYQQALVKEGIVPDGWKSAYRKGSPRQVIEPAEVTVPSWQKFSPAVSENGGLRGGRATKR